MKRLSCREGCLLVTFTRTYRIACETWATTVRALWLVTKRVRFCCNDLALLAGCPGHGQSVFNFIVDIQPRSVGSCQKRYPLTSVTWLYRELKCTTHRGDVFVKVIRRHLLVLIDRRLRSIMERPYDNLSTSSVRSLQGNLRPRPWCIDLAKCIKALVSDFPLMMVKWVVYIKVSKTNCNLSEEKDYNCLK